MIPSRVKESSANQVLSMATRSSYRSFMAKEELTIIIIEVENVGKRAAGRKYDMSESCIRDWHKKQNAS